MSITILMNGGLGNQLFQYAAGRAVAIARNTSLQIDLRYYTDAVLDSSKAPWILDFPIKATIKRYSSARASHGFIPRAIRKVTERGRYHRSALGFDPSVLDVADNSILIGVFQSPRYFSDVWPQIVEELDLSGDTLVPTNNLVSQFDLQRSVGIHVRRGDYLNDPDFMMENSELYYRKVMNEVRLRGERAIIFSDDIAWCRDQTIFAGADFYPVVKEVPPYVDLFAMSHCKRLVIANSSFSWWAGWFAHCRGAEVTAPTRWIFGRRSDEIAILPTSWRQC